jgi:hypothetical protein
MTIKTPEDFVKIGHVRPVAFVRDVNPHEGYLKECRMGPDDLERLAAWCLNVAAWCRESGAPTVQLNDGAKEDNQSSVNPEPSLAPRAPQRQKKGR